MVFRFQAPFFSTAPLGLPRFCPGSNPLRSRHRSVSEDVPSRAVPRCGLSPRDRGPRETAADRASRLSSRLVAAPAPRAGCPKGDSPAHHRAINGMGESPSEFLRGVLAAVGRGRLQPLRLDDPIRATDRASSVGRWSVAGKEHRRPGAAQPGPAAGPRTPPGYSTTKRPTSSGALRSSHGSSRASAKGASLTTAITTRSVACIMALPSTGR
jgi:hypothetical protein